MTRISLCPPKKFYENNTVDLKITAVIYFLFKGDRVVVSSLWDEQLHETLHFFDSEMARSFQAFAF